MGDTMKWDINSMRLVTYQLHLFIIIAIIYSSMIATIHESIYSNINSNKKIS